MNIVNELLGTCRRITARIQATSQKVGWEDRGAALTADALALANAFDALDARIIKVGVPDSWHPLLKRRSDPPTSQR